MKIERRWFLAGTAASLAAPAVAQTATVVDGAGRAVAIPRDVRRVFPAGPPAAILLYTLAPDLLIGWPRAHDAATRAFLLPEIGGRPELGRITGRGNTANLEVVLQHNPDLILDSGSVRQTYVELADRVQTQTGIPYALLDGSFAATPTSYETLGRLIGRQDRARELARYAEETMRVVKSRIDDIPASARPRVYFARGPAGLETGLGGSINVETLEFLGIVNVAAERQGGLATVSLEQVLRWNPDAIVTIDPAFAKTAGADPAWRGVKAVADGRVYLSPSLPFGWVDFPPGVNRLIGLWWLGKTIFPALFPEDIRGLAKDFYRRFYQVDLDDAQIARVMSAQG